MKETDISRPGVIFLPPRAAQLRVGPVPNINCPVERASPYLALFLQGKMFNLAAIPPHLRRGEPRRKCSGHPGSGPSARWRRLCQSSLQGSKTFALATLPRCQPQTAPGSTIRALISPESFDPALSWAVPAQAPEAVCLTLLPPVFVGVWEPKVSQTLHRQSLPAPHLPDRLRGHAPLRSAPYGTGRLTEAPQGHRHNRSICETASTIGPPETPASAISGKEPASPARRDGSRDKEYIQRGSSWRCCRCSCP